MTSTALGGAGTPRAPPAERGPPPFVPESGAKVAAQVRVGVREGKNAFPAAEDGRHILEMFGHFRIIPRNDFLSHPLPVPVHQGTTMWGWDGFLNYCDEKFPKRWEYQRYSGRALDFYEPLNQAGITLEETAGRGVLKVEIDTFTPGFETLLVRLDGGPWTEQRSPAWTWTLKPGKNTLEVRARNVRGVLGPPSAGGGTLNP